MEAERSPTLIPTILAQAPLVASALGKWPGFVLMMTAILVSLAMGLATIIAASKAVARILEFGRAVLSVQDGRIPP